MNVAHFVDTLEVRGGGMVLEGKVSKLTRDEIDRLYGLFESMGSVSFSEASQSLSQRNLTTIRRAYNVAKLIFNQDPLALTDNQASEIASRAKYGTTTNFVQDMFRSYRWRQDRIRLLANEHANLKSVMSQVWVPDPEEVPVRPFLDRVGLHNEIAGQRYLKWDQQGPRVTSGSTFLY